MANVLYNKAKEAFLSGSINLTSDTIKVALIDTSAYTFSQAHQFWSSVSAGQIGSSVTLASITITLGVFDSADPTFATVSGSTVEALVIYKDTGVAGTSPLIAYIDTATGLPVTPNGGDITVTFDNGVNRIFALV